MPAQRCTYYVTVLPSSCERKKRGGRESEREREKHGRLKSFRSRIRNSEIRGRDIAQDINKHKRTRGTGNGLHARVLRLHTYFARWSNVTRPRPPPLSVQKSLKSRYEAAISRNPLIILPCDKSRTERVRFLPTQYRKKTVRVPLSLSISPSGDENRHGFTSQTKASISTEIVFLSLSRVN